MLEIAHSSRRNNPELARLDLDVDHLMRVVRKETDAPSLRAERSSPTEKDAARNVAFDGRNQLAFKLDEAGLTSIEHTEDSKTDWYENSRELELTDYPPELVQEEVEIVLRCSDLKTIIEVVTTNTVTLIGDCLISAFRSSADGNRLSLVGTAVSITVETAIGD